MVGPTNPGAPWPQLAPIAEGFERGYACVKVAPPQSPKCDTVGNPVEVLSGAKTQVAVDYGTGASRRALRVERVYRSDITGQMSLLGSGWSLAGWLRLGVSRAASGVVTLNLSDGRSKFFFSSDGQNWEAENFDADRLVVLSGNSGWLHYSMQDGIVSRFDSAGRLVASALIEGGAFGFGLSSEGRPTYTEDAFGRRVTFSYDADGFIESVTLPSGSLSYVRSAIDDLSTAVARKSLTRVTFADSTSRTYLYDEVQNLTSVGDSGSLLTGIEAETALRLATFKYQGTVNSYGALVVRAVSTERAGGTGKFSLTRSSTGGYAEFISVTDPLGAARQTETTAIAGSKFQSLVLPAYRSQPAGSGCPARGKNIFHDANGNREMEEAFNGTAVCYANDLTRNLELVRVEGLGTWPACSAYTPTGATLPTGARKVSTQWHPDWQKETKVAEPGRITSKVYNGQPDPFNSGAIASCAPVSAVLPDGKPIAVLCRQVEQATTDANGSQGFSAVLQSGVAKREQKWTYDQWGQVLTHDGPRTDVSDITTYTYHSETLFTGTDPNAVGHTLGDLKSVTNAAGKVINYTKYNKHGQLMESVDSNGVITTQTFDLRQRLLSRNVGGQTTSYTYDAAGQLKRVTFPDASWIGYEHDDAQRQTAVLDSRGNRIEYLLDNAGNRVAEYVKDPGGSLKRTLARSIDALGRVQQTTGRE